MKRLLFIYLTFIHTLKIEYYIKDDLPDHEKKDGSVKMAQLLVTQWFLLCQSRTETLH